MSEVVLKETKAQMDGDAPMGGEPVPLPVNTTLGRHWNGY